MAGRKTRETTMLALRIDAELKGRLERLAERERRSLTRQTELVIEAGLAALAAGR